MKSIRYFVFLVLLISCSNNSVERVRIVDANGNPARINKIVPKFNEEQLAKQREAFSTSNNTRTDINRFRQDYNSVQSMNKNSEAAIVSSDQNIITPINNRYPSDIFADRITNYNYIQDTKVVQDNREKTRNQIIEDMNSEIIEGDIIDSSKPIIDKKQQTKTISKNDDISTKNIEMTKNTRSANNEITKQRDTKKTTNSNTKTGKYYIQIGVYSEKNNADLAYKKYSKISSGTIDEYSVKNRKKYKVLLGPYNDRKTAEKNLEKVIKTGHYDVYITEKK